MDQNSSIKATLLYVDDEEANLKAFERAFRFDYEIILANNAQEAMDQLKKRKVQLIVTDQRMPGLSGLDFLQEAIRLQPSAIRIILTAFNDNDVLLRAIQEGKVYDFVLKPWKKELMAKRLTDALQFYRSQNEKIARLQNRMQAMEVELQDYFHAYEIIGANQGLKKVMDQLKRVAPTQSTVLIRGESGTGKELIAHAIHFNSPRRENPFIKVNASAFSSGVLESELFGHEKGAFTGALQQKKGRFELADEGSLFLDEIGDLPESIQVKLLRTLQEGEFERVGGSQTLKVNVRLIAATHRPLELLIEEGKFREDLFYRINVIPLWLPPLRERREDIPALLDFFLQKMNQTLGKNICLNAQTIEKLCAYSWPGNIRELKNRIECLAVLADPDAEISPRELPMQNTEETALETIEFSAIRGNLQQKIQNEEIEKMTQALERARGNLAEAARLLGLPRTTLFSRLKKYQII